MPNPPQGYQLNPRVPAGYQMNPKAIPFSQAVSNAASQPMSPDIEDRRNPTMLDNILTKVKPMWDELKNELQSKPAPAVQPVMRPDASFYDPHADASRK